VANSGVEGDFKRESREEDRLNGMVANCLLTDMLSVVTPAFSEIAYHPNTRKYSNPIPPNPMIASRINIGIGDSSSLLSIFSPIRSFLTKVPVGPLGKLS
jgi:hypothetical protein